MVASWLKETLTLTNIRAWEGLTRKATASYVAIQGASVKTITEAGEWTHTSTRYGHF